jgi:hypothetical protein
MSSVLGGAVFFPGGVDQLADLLEPLVSRELWWIERRLATDTAVDSGQLADFLGECLLAERRRLGSSSHGYSRRL